ncbi:MAG: ImmA/IrrE family metallo-endopeptidase [Solirubrobacterales bacterium]
MSTTELDLERIESKANSILGDVPDYIWNGQELPVPVEDIIDSMFGLMVRDVNDMSKAPGAPEDVHADQISGLLLTGLGEIWVNETEANRWPTRRRFTISHELGHWVLHRTGQQQLFCRTVEVISDRELAEAERKVTTRPAIPVTEEEANAFAAALLMPAHLVNEHHERCKGDMALLRETFNCSEKAMNRRVESVVPPR